MDRFLVLRIDEESGRVIDEIPALTFRDAEIIQLREEHIHEGENVLFRIVAAE